jgi:hypothetical protein
MHLLIEIFGWHLLALAIGGRDMIGFLDKPMFLRHNPGTRARGEVRW